MEHFLASPLKPQVPNSAVVKGKWSETLGQTQDYLRNESTSMTRFNALINQNIKDKNMAAASMAFSTPTPVAKR